MFETIPLIFQASLAILIGFAGLIWSADRFVAGSAAIARSYGIAPLIIGLTIVSFGTSAPEVMVSISAALKASGDLAVGNAIGSNIANIGLVLGATTLVARIPVQHHILKDELPVLLVVTLVAGFALYDTVIVRWEGWALLALLGPAIWYLVSCKQGDLSAAEIAEEEDIPLMPRKLAFFWFALGLVVLMISSEILIWGAKNTAEHFGVSPFIIGLTVIAVGTSLPELAASVMSAIRGHLDIALGNVIGSNMFNLLAVMAIPGIIHPPEMDATVFHRDYLVMLGFTLFLGAAIVVAIKYNGTTSPRPLGRAFGSLLLLAYVSYYIMIFSGQ